MKMFERETPKYPIIERLKALTPDELIDIVLLFAEGVDEDGLHPVNISDNQEEATQKEEDNG